MLVLMFGTGWLTRLLTERKKTIRDEVLKDEKINNAICGIEKDISALRKDGEKNELAIKDLEHQLNELKLAMASKK
jgi:hypothetical protein